MKFTGLVCSITISRHQSPTEIYGQNQESTPIHHPQFLHHRTPPARCSSCVTETQRLPDTNILNAYRTDHCEQGPGSHFQEQGQQQFRRSARQYHRGGKTQRLLPDLRPQLRPPIHWARRRTQRGHFPTWPPPSWTYTMSPRQL